MITRYVVNFFHTYEVFYEGLNQTHMDYITASTYRNGTLWLPEDELVSLAVI